LGGEIVVDECDLPFRKAADFCYDIVDIAVALALAE